VLTGVLDAESPSSILGDAPNRKIAVPHDKGGKVNTLAAALQRAIRKDVPDLRADPNINRADPAANWSVSIGFRTVLNYMKATSWARNGLSSVESQADDR